MKNTRQKINKKGFTLIELIAVLVIISVILGAVLAVAKGTTDASRITSTISSIRALQTASADYYNINGGTYTGGSIGTISLPLLASQGMLPAVISGTNAWNGTMAVLPNNGNSGYLDIVLTGVPSTAQAALNSAVSNLVQTIPTYSSANGGTWTGTF